VVTDKKQLLIGIIIQINCRGEWQPVTKQLLAKAKNGGIGKTGIEGVKNKQSGRAQVCCLTTGRVSVEIDWPNITTSLHTLLGESHHVVW
jgi:hypothetical protein